ncbi:hypothetical protein WMY93_016906 [Mugilogobius chulae]|uniref:Uncharacterized protein n=1 Tax=Mugilogobius chulae TaxID=88201 RepID=A0AAW0NT59_9GOBI
MEEVRYSLLEWQVEAEVEVEEEAEAEVEVDKVEETTKIKDSVMKNNRIKKHVGIVEKKDTGNVTNRIALDMLLAEKGGVCAIFNDQCCTFIPNNTATGGKLTLALEGLRTMNKRMKDQSGVNTSMWDDWMSVFGQWKGLVSSALIAVAVFAALLTLCGCCCIPCIRALLTKLINTAIAPDPKDIYGQMPLLADKDDEPEEDLFALFNDSKV